MMVMVEAAELEGVELEGVAQCMVTDCDPIAHIKSYLYANPSHSYNVEYR